MLARPILEPMAFPCPSCGAAVSRNPDSWGLRCDACGARLRARARADEGSTRVYEIEAAADPGTHTRVEIPWTPADARRLRRWLAWSTAITLWLVVVLLLLAVLGRLS
jgi:hypothetical protein